MDIIGTINPWGCDNFNELINKIINKGVRYFRVNLKTYYKKEHFEYLTKIIYEMMSIEKDILFIFDIGYPKDTSRTIINNDKGYIEIKENDIYISNNSPNYSDNTIFIDPEIYLEINDVIYYGDGQYYLTIIDEYGDGIWKARVSNTNIKIWGNTALHFKNESRYTPYNIYLILNFLNSLNSKIKYKVALSFVESKKDVDSFINLSGIRNIICKIESQAGVDNIEEIIPAADSIMLGRGDLLFNSKVECFLHNEVQVIKKCKENRKAIIVSTGILSSMEQNMLPTRAELIDFILLKELGVDIINLSGHIIKSRNIDWVMELINNTGRIYGRNSS